MKTTTEAKIPKIKTKTSKLTNWTKNKFLAKFQLLICRKWCPLCWCPRAQFRGLSHQSCKTMTKPPPFFFFFLFSLEEHKRQKQIKIDKNWKKKNKAKIYLN
jgi:hypothetical protein